VQDELPLRQAFVLYATICARYDLKPKGPTYVEMEILEALNRALPQPKKKRK
jgi:hypothetical protein